MNTLDALFLALERSPDDWLARAALADCYEEAGLANTADCLRWMLGRRLRPSLRLAGGAFWFDGAHPYLLYTDRDAYLPAPLFTALREGQALGQWVRFYDRPRDAEEDLFAAWADAARSSPELCSSGRRA